MTDISLRKFTNIIILTALLLLKGYIDVNAGILTTKNGLSSSLINDIYQTSDGTVWITTEDGLNRYDGAKSQIYKNDVNDSTSIRDSHTLTVLETSDNKIYVGTEHGLARYNADKDIFERIPLMSSNGYGELLAYISGMVEFNEDILYIATSGHGLFEYSRKTNKARQLDLKLGFYISEIFKDSKNNIWIATSDKGVFRISDNAYVYSVKINGENFTCFCEDEYGNIYAGSLKNGLSVHNNDTEEFTSASEETNKLHIKSIKYYHGEVLIGTDGSGIYRFDPQQKKLRRFNISSMPFDCNKAKVHSILVDQCDNLWLGLFQKGIVVVPTCNNDFKYVGYKSGMYNHIGSNYISSLLFTPDSILYVGTDNDGLYTINYKKHEYKHYDNSQGSPSTILSMEYDKDGNIWMGTYLEGLFMLNTKTNQCKSIRQWGNLKFPEESIYDIASDKKQNIWFASMGGGLTLYDQKNGTIYRYPTKGGFDYRENLDMLHNRWINCLHYSSASNKLYIGSLDGLGCLDVTSGSFTTTFGRNRIMSQCRINDITEDKNGNIWVASNLGITKLSTEDNKVETTSTINGITIENIKAIECDLNGIIWASTSNGIFRIDPETMQSDNYYEQDGILTSEFSYRSSYRGFDGQIFFGGTDGLTYFLPEQISTTYQKPRIRVADFYINGQRVLPSTLSNDKPVKEYNPKDSTTIYNLGHTDNTFTLEFTTLEAFPQQGMKYMYTITKGNEQSEQITSNSDNMVTFRNMEPDTYKINVTANNNGHNSDPLTITVIVHPAIYATTIAKIIYFILTCLVIYFILKQYKMRQKTKLQLAETLHNQQMHAAKMDMFTNIAHEIRTPMSLVIAPLKELMSTDNDPSHKANYDVIQRNTQRILRLMAQVLDIQKIDAGKMKLHFCPTDVNKIVNDVCLTFDFEARAKNIVLKCNRSTQDEVIVYVDPQHFDQIITNLVSNAIKYTPRDGEVTINSYIDNNNYIFKVEDTGNGFSEDDIKHLFERFHRLSNSEIGFGIGLDLTNTIVQLHHGTIIPSNKPNGKGGVMTVTIPLGTNHLKDEDVEEKPIEQITPSNESIVEQEENKKPKTNLRIVLADDDPEIRNYIKTHLSDTYTIVTCSDGREALEEILANVPDLVVTDVVMPNMDGFTLCRNIKHNVNINYLPVVILTARSADTDRIESYENGADAYIAKPFSIDELSATIKNLISQRQKFMANIMAQQQVLESVDSIPTAATLSYNEQLMQRITAAINANISDSEYSIEDLAREVGLSRVHLHRKMKEITNMTTRDYVRNVRLKYAETLLLSKRYDIQQIADMTGFSTPTYFAKAFKVFYGQSPKEFMNSNDKSPEE